MPDFYILEYGSGMAAEISAAVLRIYEGGPAILSQRHTFPRTSLTGPGTTGVRLVLKKKEEEKEQQQEKEEEAKRSSSQE
jgi:hypothetical protein